MELGVWRVPVVRGELTMGDIVVVVVGVVCGVGSWGAKTMW